MSLIEFECNKVKEEPDSYFKNCYCCYKGVGRHGYITMASFINEVWEEGFWQKLEKKYGDFAGKSFCK